ncbi:MAG: UDP-3-O-[3-hydroxymyristoyl] glucosamine N-acyltransferase [Flavobacteriales bacterium]|jgi:UDP-3-O-[3-hydroxymyristoyl] glucosamine N-acyltransferase
MEFSAQQIADLLEGNVLGNSEATVNNLSKIEEGQSGTLSFLANPKYTEYIYTTKATIVIVSKDFKAEQELPSDLTLIKVEDAYKSFGKLLEIYNQLKHNKSGIDKQTHIESSATLGDDIYVGAFSYIGENSVIGENVKIYPGCFIGDDVTIGDNCILYQGTKVYSACVVGNDCMLHAGVIIGGDGFGFAPNSENNYQKVAQIGNVIIEDHVEVGANTTIDRATLGSTVIRKGVKLDNLIQVAHNVEIGENTVIAAQTGIAGSTKIGKNCMIGGQVGMAGHLNIADGVKIAAQSGIGNNITEPNTIVQGSPAFGIGEYKRSYVLFKGLPKLRETINTIRKELNELKQNLK